jgi:hydrogenase maturation factor
MTHELAPRCGPDEHCITCGDEAARMRVLAVEGASGLARCAADDGGESDVDTALVEPVAAGDSVLVHAGVALVRLDEVAA